MPITGGERYMMVDTTEEAVPGVKNGSQTRKAFRVVGGGIGLKENPEFVDTEEHANTLAQPAPVLASFRPGGTVQVIPSPYDSGVDFDPGAGTKGFLRWLLDAAHVRGSGRLKSWSLYDAVPGILTREVLGCKLAGYSLGWGENGKKLDVAADLLALNAGALVTALTSGDAGTLPSSRDWFISLVSIQVGADTTVVTNNRTVKALNLKFSNSLDAEGTTYYYPSGRTVVRSMGVQDLQEGEQSCEGSFDLRLDDTSWYGRFEAGTTGALRILGFHKDSLAFTFTGATTTGNPVLTISEDYTTGQIEVGDYVYLEDPTAADPASWKKEVLKVKAVTPAGGGGVNTIQLETDGATDAESVGRSQVFATGSRLYTRGFQYLIRQFTIQDWEPTGGVRDMVGQRIPFRASPSGSNPLCGYMLR